MSVADASGGGSTGTVANTTWAAAGKYGKALTFNGTSSRVTVPNSASLQLTTAMTLEAWVNPTTVNSAWRDVIEKGNDNYYLMGTSTPSSRPAGGGIIGGSYGEAFGTAAMPTNTWVHLAVTYDGAAVRLYVNGTQVSSVAKTGSILTSTSPLTIGSDPFYGQYFRGMIDEVRVYNIALTATQIQADMTTPITPAAPDTQAPTAPGTLSATAISRPDRSQLGRSHRQRRCHRLPDRTLPGRRLHHLHPDRCPTGTPPATATPQPPRTPATATASAPATPPPTSAPTQTPPPPPPRPRRTRRRRRARRVERDSDLEWPDRSQLGRRHRQRRCHRLPDRTLPGRRLHHLRPDRCPDRHRHQLQRYHSRRQHQLQLPRPRHRRRPQPRPLHKHRHRHHPQHLRPSVGS